MLDFTVDFFKKKQTKQVVKVYFTSACGGPELLQMLQLHLVALEPVVRLEANLLEMLITKTNTRI